MQPSHEPVAIRAFARLNAIAMTPSPDGNDRGLFLTWETDPDDPEPELWGLG